MSKFVFCAIAWIAVNVSVVHAQINLPLLRTSGFQEADASVAITDSLGVIHGDSDYDLDGLDALAYALSQTDIGYGECKSRAIASSPSGVSEFVPYLQGEGLLEISSQAQTNNSGAGRSFSSAEYLVQNNPNHPGHAPNGTLRAMIIVQSNASTDGYITLADWEVAVGRSRLVGEYVGDGLWRITGNVADGDEDIPIDFVGAGIVIEAIEPVSVGDTIAARCSTRLFGDQVTDGAFNAMLLPQVALSVRVP